jgi:hypothetical protein
MLGREPLGDGAAGKFGDTSDATSQSERERIRIMVELNTGQFIGK